MFSKITPLLFFFFVFFISPFKRKLSIFVGVFFVSFFLPSLQVDECALPAHCLDRRSVQGYRRLAASSARLFQSRGETAEFELLLQCWTAANVELRALLGTPRDSQVTVHLERPLEELENGREIMSETEMKRCHERSSCLLFLLL